MDNKNVTIMVVPDRKSRVFKVTLTAGRLKLFLWLGALSIVLLTAMVVDYVSLLAQSFENKRLHAENAELRGQFQVIESKLTSVEAALDRIKAFSTKLRLITAVDDPERGLNLAMGPLPRPGASVDELNEPLEKRSPASAPNAFNEPVFKTKSLNDVTGGILAEEADHDYSKLSVQIDRVLRVGTLREQNMQELWEQLQDRSSLLGATPLLRPADGWFTSRFGYRVSPYSDKPVMHQGLDIGAPPGTAVRAPADGKVTHVGYDSGYGKVVFIDHGYGVETRYGHNSQVLVSEGQRIKRGDMLSTVGSTGRSTGPHVHYEVRVNGIPVDPMNYIIEE